RRWHRRRARRREAPRQRARRGRARRRRGAGRRGTVTGSCRGRLLEAPKHEAAIQEGEEPAGARALRLAEEGAVDGLEGGRRRIERGLLGESVDQRMDLLSRHPRAERRRQGREEALLPWCQVAGLRSPAALDT